MTSEGLRPALDRDPAEERLHALAGFILIAQQNPKSAESRSLDEWQYEAACLRTDTDRADHIEQRFKELLSGDEHLLPFYLMAQEDLNKNKS